MKKILGSVLVLLLAIAQVPVAKADKEAPMPKQETVKESIVRVANQYPFQVVPFVKDKNYCTGFLNDLKSGNFEEIQSIVASDDYKTFMKKLNPYLDGCQLTGKKGKPLPFVRSGSEISKTAAYDATKGLNAFLIVPDDRYPQETRILFSGEDLIFAEDYGAARKGDKACARPYCATYKILDPKECRYEPMVPVSRYFTWQAATNGFLYDGVGGAATKEEISQTISAPIKYKGKIVFIGTAVRFLNDGDMAGKGRSDTDFTLSEMTLVDKPAPAPGEWFDKQSYSKYKWDEACDFYVSPQSNAEHGGVTK